jgi:hypothetical protein
MNPTGTPGAAQQVRGEMTSLKRLWLFLALLSVGFTSLPVGALAQAAADGSCAVASCCCEESCGCDHAPVPADCSIGCRDTRLPVSLQPTPAAPTPEWAVLATIQAFFLDLQPRTLHLSHLSMPAGWTLPHSPPLGSHLLNLPPPANHLS